MSDKKKDDGKKEKDSPNPARKILLPLLLVFVACVIGRLLYIRWRDNKPPQTSIWQTETPRSAPKSGWLKAGAKKEMLVIRGYMLTVHPDASGMRFWLFDKDRKPIMIPGKDGKLAEYTEKLQNWEKLEPKPYHVTFATIKEDKEWEVERWRKKDISTFEP